VTSRAWRPHNTDDIGKKTHAEPKGLPKTASDEEIKDWGDGAYDPLERDRERRSLATLSSPAHNDCIVDKDRRCRLLGIRIPSCTQRDGTVGLCEGICEYVRAFQGRQGPSEFDRSEGFAGVA
jgi:hypothetical protein